jgi:hypothetical protein
VPLGGTDATSKIMMSTTDHSKLDVVIPIAPKDLNKLLNCITSIVSNCTDKIRYIFVICPHALTKEIHKDGQVIAIDEELFPFSKRQITALMNSIAGNKIVFSNTGWYFQQLLKLYVFRIIPDLLENVLILDSDFFFCKRVTFFSENPTPKILLAHGYPFDWERNNNRQRESSLAKFAERLLPQWKIMDEYSGIHHHSVFDRAIVTSLLNEVETFHKEDFWIAYIRNLDLSKWNAGSEYTLYYHYALQRFWYLVETRHLNSCDFIVDASVNISIETLLTRVDIPTNIDAVGFHSLVQMAERFDPCKLMRLSASKSIVVYRIYLINGNVDVTPMLLDLT